MIALDFLDVLGREQTASAILRILMRDDTQLLYPASQGLTIYP
jgi:hypothetical protein